jgi:hypothetical protein
VIGIAPMAAVTVRVLPTKDRPTIILDKEDHQNKLIIVLSLIIIIRMIRFMVK